MFDVQHVMLHRAHNNRDHGLHRRCVSRYDAALFGIIADEIECGRRTSDRQNSGLRMHGPMHTGTIPGSV